MCDDEGAVLVTRVSKFLIEDEIGRLTDLLEDLYIKYDGKSVEGMFFYIHIFCIPLGTNRQGNVEGAKSYFFGHWQNYATHAYLGMESNVPDAVSLKERLTIGRFFYGKLFMRMASNRVSSFKKKLKMLEQQKRKADNRTKCIINTQIEEVKKEMDKSPAGRGHKFLVEVAKILQPMFEDLGKVGLQTKDVCILITKM